ncbi:hypothetical protein B0J17DRAFT_633840 [Rhizoctonia solani]|nr:hypothetical protein B0J17DRAFT_633840 [Rhizoctonia solani]
MAHTTPSVKTPRSLENSMGFLQMNVGTGTGTDYMLVRVEDLEETGSGPEPGAEPDQPIPVHHSFPVKCIQRPYETHGKRPPKGFHAGDVFGLSCDKFGSRVLIKRLPTSDKYKPGEHWPIDCLIGAALKSSKGAHNRQQRQIKVNKVWEIDQETQKQELAKKTGSSGGEGMGKFADTPAQKDTGPPAQENAESLAGDRVLPASNSSDDAMDESNGFDDAVNAILNEGVSMSLLTTMVDSEEPVLPADLAAPSPPSQVLVAAHSATSEAPPSTSETSHTLTTPDLSADSMQLKLECVNALSPAARTQLPFGARLLLDMIDTGSQLSDPELLADVLNSIPGTLFYSCQHDFDSSSTAKRAGKTEDAVVVVVFVVMVVVVVVVIVVVAVAVAVVRSPARTTILGKQRSLPPLPDVPRGVLIRRRFRYDIDDFHGMISSPRMYDDKRRRRLWQSLTPINVQTIEALGSLRANPHAKQSK